MPMSSPQMTRMLGLSVFAIDSLLLRDDLVVARRDREGFFAARFAINPSSPEGSDVEDHAQDRSDSDQEQNQGRNQRERRWKAALSVDKAAGGHDTSFVAQPEHELQVINDAPDQHQ